MGKPTRIVFLGWVEEIASGGLRRGGKSFNP